MVSGGSALRTAIAYPYYSLPLQTCCPTRYLVTCSKMLSKLLAISAMSMLMSMSTVTSMKLYMSAAAKPSPLEIRKHSSFPSASSVAWGGQRRRARVGVSATGEHERQASH